MTKKTLLIPQNNHGCRAFRFEKLWFGRYKQEKKLKTQIWEWDADSIDAVYHTDLWGATIHSL